MRAHWDLGMSVKVRLFWSLRSGGKMCCGVSDLKGHW